ncbi:alpha/beta hydrolase-fold protein [Rhodococcus sp. X156]|uniref:alpha/beta hydrolase-fold protein n=1 Tax=Rhodococcus sp. X156 TaxID=2499145 RepID=UPI0013E3E26D|nr:alpha/beta hydrolase-fold protein [Rhodococcus sp. X156]
MLPLSAGVGAASAAPTPSPTQVTPGVPIAGANGAYVIGAPAIAGQLARFNVYSPSMGRDVPIQVLLPAGYNINAATTYPELYQLDGLRADANITDWTRKADTQGFFANKNVLVVQPIGGYGSFYQDWQTDDPGILAQAKQNPGSPVGTLKWESFLTKELPFVIGNAFHGNGQRAISGLSMSGFSAFSLAAKHPGLYKAAASYSGYPDIQGFGLPEYLRYVLGAESGATNPDNIWGPNNSPAWTANNPTVQVAKLKNVSLYMSAGTGGNGPYDEALGFLGLSRNYVGALIEVISNYSSQNFAQVAGANSVAVTTDLTNPGVHDWPYWSDQYKRSWPQLAKAIGATEGVAVTGAIAVKWNQLGGANSLIGTPTSAERDVPGVPGARVASFTNGEIYWSQATGAQAVQGAIRARYNELGGPTGLLGLPVTDERTTPNGVGRFNQFQGSGGGYIYWTPSTGAHEVYGLILEEWARQGYENSKYGFPTRGEFDIPGGRQTNFQNGFIQFVNGQIIAS